MKHSLPTINYFIRLVRRMTKENSPISDAPGAFGFICGMITNLKNHIVRLNKWKESMDKKVKKISKKVKKLTKTAKKKPAKKPIKSTSKKVTKSSRKVVKKTIKKTAKKHSKVTYQRVPLTSSNPTKVKLPKNWGMVNGVKF